MPFRFLCALLVFTLGCAASVRADTPLGSPAAAPQEITTQFTYTATTTPPAGTKSLDLWVPLPSDSVWQKVSGISVTAPVSYQITREKRYGDRMVHVHEGMPSGPLVVSVQFTVRRREVRVLQPVGGIPEDRSLKASLAEDQKVPVGGEFATIAQEITGSDQTDLDKEHSLFDHVVATMRYDYNHQSPEYAEGDSAFVCSYKSGNCTDLHSYLTSLSRSVGIPAVIEFGFPITGIPLASPLPDSGTVSSYHCWVWFKDPSLGWVPMDAADARRWNDSRRPDIAHSLFGDLVLARSAVAMSRGRDITLAPAQKGPPLNYFIYPYAEADGAPVAASWKLSYQIAGRG